MIDEEDIKVGLKFTLTYKDCEKCGYDPDGFSPLCTITFDIVCEDKNGICTCDTKIWDRSVAFITKENIAKYGFACKYEEQVEQVEHPIHYSWLKDLCGVEPIDICRHFDFAVGNALKYLMRKGKVDGNKTEKEKRIEDLKKAVFYLQDEIKLLSDGKE